MAFIVIRLLLLLISIFLIINIAFPLIWPNKYAFFFMLGRKTKYIETLEKYDEAMTINVIDEINKSIKDKEKKQKALK